MNKPAYLEMSYEEKLTKYATLAEMEIDVVLDKVFKSTLASCSGDIQTYSDQLKALYDEGANTNLIFSTTMKEAIFRRGLPERLRMRAAIIQASDLYISSPSPSSFIIAALQDIQATIPESEPSNPAKQASPPPETFSPSTKRKAKGDDGTAILPATCKKHQPSSATAAATSSQDDGSIIRARSRKKRASKANSEKVPGPINVKKQLWGDRPLHPASQSIPNIIRTWKS